ncbi:SusC/RagA family TonB-linked outer membrane protein [Algibacter luteus]|uniref:SusC/RagA family TonB-linked outer membrane protein n=1 Tax=Algibacter luteus TaxID=1178825 RepID=UPI002592A1A7|nr:TonB-dependent receptor [Algibacter luteus]WJJ95710.1 TonB-dependent receptor [Algibacter luteus]
MKKKLFLNCSGKKRKSLLFSLTLFLCFSIIGMAQNQVSGKVTDEASFPLPGANVIKKGTTTGTQADFDGNFSIEAVTGDILVISYLGYVTQEVIIANKTSLTIVLIEDASQLDEVVVVGYGSKSKTKLISAVSTIDEETLKKQPVPNVSNALEGLASGLFVSQGSGEPGFSNSSFEVRNFGSALVIVDGAPGDLNQLDPNEIENISVLKDASAAAVYGVQGGNGVVLITTRKGKIGKPKLTYSNQFTYTSFTSYPEYLSSADRAEILNEGLRNAGAAQFYTDEEVELFRSGADPINYPNTDWRDLVLKDWGFQQQHNLNLSGGTEKVKYFVSAGYVDQGSNYTEDVLSFQRYNLRTNINADVTDNLNLTVNLGARRQLNETPGYSAYDIFRELSRSLPNDLAYYPDGTPARPSTTPNHVIEGIRDFNAGYFRARNNNFDAKVSLEWDVKQIEGLKLKSYASLVYNTNFNKDWDTSFDLFTLNRQTGNYDVFRSTPPGSPSETKLTQSTSYSNHYVLQESINYERTFGDHHVSGLLLAEIQKIQGQDFSAFRQDFQSTAIDQLFAGAIENQGANGGEFRENRLGFVGRFGYDYKSKYFIESTYRYDGSSRFAPGNEYGLFPSMSLGWRISEEPFFEPLKNTVSNLKLRASIGTAGNDGTAGYQWLSGFNYSFFFAINDTAIPTIDNTALPNRDITWETNTTYDVGLDVDLFNNDLKFSFDYFFRKREDVIAGANASVPSTLGVALAAQNFYEFSNEGFEFSIDYKKQLNDDLKISALLNFSKSREKAVFIDETFQEDPFMRANLTETGGFTGLRRGYISDGLFQSQEEIDQWAIQDDSNNTSLQPGDVRYVDLNEDGIIDVRDQKVFGDGSKPAINYSLNLGAEYKNFALSVLLTGAAGYDIYLDGEAQSPLRNGFNGYDYQLDYWTPTNTGAAFPRITDGGFNNNNYRYSDFWLREGKHIRFKNINLSYTFPKKKDDATFDEIKLFCTGYNLFVIKDFDEDFDPQIGTGVGWYYPQTKSITFGVNVSL